MKKTSMLMALAAAPLFVACAGGNQVVTPERVMSTKLVEQVANPDVLAAVNLCSDSPAGRAAYVTDIVATPMSNIRVTTVSADGVRRTCTVDPVSKQIISMDAMGRDVNQVFVPVKLSPQMPTGTCFVGQRVVQNDLVQGWILTRNPTGNCAGDDWLAPLEARR